MHFYRHARRLEDVIDVIENAARKDERDLFMGLTYDLKEASLRSKYSIPQLFRYVKAGEIPNVGGGQIEVSAWDLPCRPGRMRAVLGLAPIDEDGPDPSGPEENSASDERLAFTRDEITEFRRNRGRRKSA